MRELMPDRSTTRDATALPDARGPFSEGMLDLLAGGGVAARRPSPPKDPLGDDDLHLALFLAYELHYRGLPGVLDEREWDPRILAVRLELEGLFELALRRAIEHREAEPEEVRCRRSSNARRP